MNFERSEQNHVGKKEINRREFSEELKLQVYAQRKRSLYDFPRKPRQRKKKNEIESLRDGNKLANERK